MNWNLVLSGLLGLSLSVRAFAEPPTEEFPDAPKTETEEALPESDEEEMEAEDIDVLGTLESIIGKMKDAEASLSKLDGFRAKDAQGNAIERAEDLLKSQDLQKKAIEEMDRVFKGGSENQKAAVEEIEKLIKAAKESS